MDLQADEEGSILDFRENLLPVSEFMLHDGGMSTPGDGYGSLGTKPNSLQVSKIKLPTEDLETGPPSIELSQRQKQDIKDAFNVFDTEGTGLMDVGQLKVALRALGFEPRKSEMKKLINHVDKTKAGKLCFTDFLDVILFKLSEKDCMDEIMKAFKLFDRDQTGKITFENLKKITAELAEGLNDEEVMEMITEADLDGDGAVDQDEFFRILKKSNLY